MRIDPLDWQVFVNAAEAQHCEHLDLQCTARTYTMTGRNSKPVVIGGCGNSVIFEVPYEGILAKPGKESLVVCAVDDNVPMWPRFGGDRYASAPVNPQDTINGMDNYDWGDEL